MGNRVRQTVGTVVTQYLLDLQPGLTQMLAQTAGAATDHFIHGPAGVLSQRDSAGGWEWMLADGLGSVRAVAGSALLRYNSAHAPRPRKNFPCRR